MTVEAFNPSDERSRRCSGSLFALALASGVFITACDESGSAPAADESALQPELLTTSGVASSSDLVLEAKIAAPIQTSSTSEYQLSGRIVPLSSED